MKRALFAAAVLAAALMLVGCYDKVPAPETAPPPPPPVQVTGLAADHPQLDEQEMYVACSDCHREVTPEIVDQWWNSGHGIGNVKCYQCHGTYEDMMRVPTEDNCAFCHEAQVAHHADGMSCWQCHPAHGFSGHNQGGQR